MSDDDIRDRLRRASEAPFAERDELLRQFAEELKRSNPEYARLISFGRREGLFLDGLYRHTFKRALERRDLREADMFEAWRDAGEFSAACEIIRQTRSASVPKQLAFDLAMNALLAGLRAGLTSDELRKLEADVRSEQQRQAAKKRGEQRRAETQKAQDHTLALALKILRVNRTLSQEQLADKVAERWGDPKSSPRQPGRRTLVGHISRLTKSGDLPQRAGPLRK